jgi:hypothetical protein
VTTPSATIWPRARLATIFRATAPLAFVSLLAVILRRFPPAEYSFYPRCPFHALFGILCPGCGATRALAALLHGNLLEALHLNIFATALFPIAFAYAAISYWRFVRRQPMHAPLPPAAAT